MFCSDCHYLPLGRTGTAVEITRRRAGWRYIDFAVRHIAPNKPWTAKTRDDECCLVLLRGCCRIEYETDRGAGRGASAARLGPRRDVFGGYPHAIYLPPCTRFRVQAEEPTELADAWAPSRHRLLPRVIRPGRLRFRVSAAGTWTRRSSRSRRPGFPPIHSMVCEVFTPAGNWSSYPPHKHDTDRPPGEVKLEEIYDHRFAHPDAYGFQRLYDRRSDRVFPVGHGDVALIRWGITRLLAAYGYNRGPLERARRREAVDGGE